MLTLETKNREKNDNKKLRNEGRIPAVFYGKKEPATAIVVDATAFGKVLKEAGESSVVTLKTEAGEKQALIKDVQFDPITDLPIHADFYVFEKDHKLEVDVPIKFEGVSPAVKELGGILLKVLHELKIKAMPKDLPHELSVDISILKDFDSQILAKDINLPSGVELVEGMEEVVALVEEAKEEVEEESVAPDLSSIEVEKKGKKDEEGGEQVEAQKPGT